MLIASLMVAGGTMVALCDSAERPVCPSIYSSLAALIGGMIALYVFMEDALHAVPEGVEKLIDLRPQHFDWPLFLLALALLSAPVVELALARPPHVNHHKEHRGISAVDFTVRLGPIQS